MGIVVENALLVDLEPPRVKPAALRIEGDRIVERGPHVAVEAADERIDAGGALVLPGLVNGHTHLYSALAVGMPPPRDPPANFRQILERIWWVLDQALDGESIEVSARIGAMLAARCGTTTLIDHHASPRCIDRSLDAVRRGIEAVGLRGVLCYETTDRHGPQGREAGLAENERFGAWCREHGGGRFAALVGAHASFTLEDDTLVQLAELAERFDLGVHIHVAEDPCDEAETLQRSGRRPGPRTGQALIRRLADAGLLRPGSLLAHGTHLHPQAVEQAVECGCTLAHNPRSNMNNAVGYAPLAAMHAHAVLGTDGIGADMIAELQTAWFISRHAHAGLGPADLLAMLARSAGYASQRLGVRLGVLEPGAAADVVITDHVPFTPLEGGDLAGHLLFGFSSAAVRDVLVAGRFVVRDRKIVTLHAEREHNAARPVAEALWRRMSAITG